MLPVLVMRPHFVEKLWGGQRLRDLPAKQREGHRPPEGRIGESWEVADLPEGQSSVDGGPFHGVSLRTMVQTHGQALVGRSAIPASDGVLRFPLLVKLIDADDDLSVQVHPDHAWASQNPGASSKDEAWLVVSAEPEACLLHGTREGVTRESFAQAIVDGRADQLLRRVRASIGDLVRIPPGTLHGVGRGCLLLEVQEPSDTTFRVFDYNRRDKNGQLRALHVQQALAVARFGEQPTPLVGGLASAMPSVQAQRFSLAVHRVDAGGEVFASDVPQVAYALEGDAVVRDAYGAHALPRGGSCIVPPGVRAEATPAQDRCTLVVMAPR